MTYKEAVRNLSPLLKEVTHIPQKEVEILLLHTLNENVIWLHLNYNNECRNFKELEKLVKKRSSSYPLEYITKRATFYGEQFFLEENVLIPRPETELLVEKAIDILSSHNQSINLVEVGVGSGIISTMLAKEIDKISITGVDINDDALELAKRNIDFHGLNSKIVLKKSNLFENVDLSNVTAVISNPPYIKNDFKLPKNVTFEPSNALFGGDIGDEILLQLINETYNNEVQYLFCEMGYDQKNRLSKYLESFDTKFVEFYKDYADFDRGFLVEFDYSCIKRDK